MFVVLRYTEPGQSAFIVIGPFPKRDDADQYGTQFCQSCGWTVRPLLPADTKVK